MLLSGTQFNQYIYLNLELQQDRKLFEDYKTIDLLTQALFFEKDKNAHKKTRFDFGIRLYAGKFSIQETKTIAGKSFKLMNLPYYAISQLNHYLKEFARAPR